jgi:hypothetical protein
MLYNQECTYAFKLFKKNEGRNVKDSLVQWFVSSTLDVHTQILKISVKTINSGYSSEVGIEEEK